MYLALPAFHHPRRWYLLRAATSVPIPSGHFCLPLSRLPPPQRTTPQPPFHPPTRSLVLSIISPRPTSSSSTSEERLRGDPQSHRQRRRATIKTTINDCDDNNDGDHDNDHDRGTPRTTHLSFSRIRLGVDDQNTLGNTQKTCPSDISRFRGDVTRQSPPPSYYLFLRPRTFAPTAPHSTAQHSTASRVPLSLAIIPSVSTFTHLPSVSLEPPCHPKSPPFSSVRSEATSTVART